MPNTYLITLDGQGRFTIPPAIFEQWSLVPSDELTFVHFGDVAVLTPVAL